MLTNTNTIRLHRVLKTTPEKLYRAFLEPAAMAKWLPPNGFTCTVHHMDVKVGGTYKMSFTNFGTGQSHSFGGKYIELTPGKSIRYRIIVTNTGTAPAINVKVFDTTPAFTVYSTNGPAVTTLGSVTAPSGAVAGSLTFDVGTLNPGQSATNTFGVVIQQ